MSIRLIVLSGIAALALGIAPQAALAGDISCSPVSANWGASYEHAKKIQIQHPDAGKSDTPVTGLDGKAAQLAIEGYRSGFGMEQAPQNYNINLGEIAGVGQK